MLLNKVFKYLTGKRIRQTLKHSLSIAGSFYFLNISYSFSFITNIKRVNLESLEILQFLGIYGLIIFLFYPFLDFILRIIFLKVMKKRILGITRKISPREKAELLRDLNKSKQVVVDFVLGYPIELGYINYKELYQIEPIEDIKVSDDEKEEAINEIVKHINKWICTLLHLLITLIVVFNYYPLLMYCFLIVGIVLTPIVFIGIILLIENIEVVGIILKELNKRVKHFSGVAKPSNENLIE